MAVFEENPNRAETEVYPFNLDLRRHSRGAIRFILGKFGHIKGDLILRDTNVDALPDELFVEGDLDLSGSSIRALPEGLTVGGDLYLTRVYHLFEFPDSLSIGGDLVLDSSINGALSKNISVGGCVIDSNYLNNLGGEKS